MKVYKIKVNGKTYKVELEAIEENNSVAPVTKEIKEDKPVTSASTEGNKVTSPIQGTVVNVKVKVGDSVKKGDVVAVVEAMKLENDIVSTFSGVVSEVLIQKGQTVESKQAIIVIK